MRARFNVMLLSLVAAVAAPLPAVYNSSLAVSKVTQSAVTQRGSQGTLQAVDPNGAPKADCPLKHTTVDAAITGFLARVTVTQDFENPFNEKIEAVYTFPLPQNAAVDDMTMIVGDRTVRGKILRREEAQAVYEAAKNSGQRASLLDQERPNIFTQSVANILPGEKIRITISYVDTLEYEDGSYEFVFPMVVGPRYVPGNPSAAGGNGFAPDTDRVPDASRITPRPAPAGMRAGHDISITVGLDAGLAVESIDSKTHDVVIERADDRRARVTLKDQETIPNKDFILRYDVAGKKISDAVLTHTTGHSGFFTLILQPPERVTAEDVTPKELVFVLDTSGSMSGFPIEKAKETMKLALDNLYPYDTFNLITFAGDTHILFPQPVPATKQNLARAQAFLESRQGDGGTEMMTAIKAALEPSDKQGHVRIVCFMTDGYVGNDMEIIGEVQKHRNARVFSFGIGGSVNRFLLDNMAKHGRGEVEYVALNDDGSAAARRFHERVRNPLLTDISLDWNGMRVSDVYPQTIPDLFGAKPLILTGRYDGTAKGVIKLKGKMSGRDFVRDVPVDFSASEQHDVLATLWARTRVEDLMSQDFTGAQQGTVKEDLKQQIIKLGLDYRLMTQFTSVVAVEEMIVTEGGQPRRVDVPIEVPQGVNRETVFGDGSNAMQSYSLMSAPMAMTQTVTVTASARTAKVKEPARAVRRSRGGSVGGGGGNSGGGGAPAPARPAAVTEAVEADAARVMTPEEKRRAELSTKLHPAVVAVVQRLIDGKPAAEAESKFVRNGKAELQIWFTEKTDEALASLKQLGFEIVLDPRTSKMVIGRMPIEKLGTLVDVKSVRYVAPQWADR